MLSNVAASDKLGVTPCSSLSIPTRPLSLSVFSSLSTRRLGMDAQPATAAPTASPSGSVVPTKRKKSKGKGKEDSSDDDGEGEGGEGDGRKAKRNRMALSCRECKVSFAFCTQLQQNRAD